MAQGWLQTGDIWRIGYAQRTNAARLRQPLEKKDLYPASADAKKEIADAIRLAMETHKRVLVVFGGNCCYDCHVLDEAFHSPEISPPEEKSFQVVHVDIRQLPNKLTTPKQYHVPLDHALP